MLNVIAMLISFIALIALVNGGMGWLHSLVAWFPSSLQEVLVVGRPPGGLGDGRVVEGQCGTSAACSARAPC